MKHFFIGTLLCLTVALTGCATSSWYANHPTTREQLLEQKGTPHRVIRASDGSEKIIYRFEGDGVVYMFYEIKDGLVVRTGMM